MQRLYNIANMPHLFKMDFFDSQPDQQKFFTVAKSEKVKPGRIVWVAVDGNPVVITRIENDLIAFSALCPHSLGDLSHGSIHNGAITCPEHGWCFNILNGESIRPEAGAYHLKKYEVKEEDGLVKVKLG